MNTAMLKDTSDEEKARLIDMAVQARVDKERERIRQQTDNKQPCDAASEELIRQRVDQHRKRMIILEEEEKKRTDVMKQERIDAEVRRRVEERTRRIQQEQQQYANDEEKIIEHAQLELEELDVRQRIDAKQKSLQAELDLIEETLQRRQVEEAAVQAQLCLHTIGMLEAEAAQQATKKSLMEAQMSLELTKEKQRLSELSYQRQILADQFHDKANRLVLTEAAKMEAMATAVYQHAQDAAESIEKQEEEEQQRQRIKKEVQLRVEQEKKALQLQHQEEIFKQQQQQRQQQQRLQDEILIHQQLHQDDMLWQQQQQQHLQLQQQLQQQTFQGNECYGLDAGQSTLEIRPNVVQAEVKFRVEQQKKRLQFEYEQQQQQQRQQQLSEDTATLFGLVATSEGEEMRLRKERERLEKEVFLRVENEKQRLLLLQRNDRIEGHSQRLEQERMRRIQRVSAEITRRVDEGRKHLFSTNVNNRILPDTITLDPIDIASTSTSTIITVPDRNTSSNTPFSSSSSSSSDTMSLHHLAKQLPESISFSNPVPSIPMILIQPKPTHNPTPLHDPTTPSLFNHKNNHIIHVNPIINPSIVPTLTRGGSKKQVDYL